MPTTKHGARTAQTSSPSERSGCVNFRLRRTFRHITSGQIRAFCCNQLVGFCHREISIFATGEKEYNKEK